MCPPEDHGGEGCSLALKCPHVSWRADLNVPACWLLPGTQVVDTLTKEGHRFAALSVGALKMGQHCSARRRALPTAAEGPVLPWVVARPSSTSSGSGQEGFSEPGLFLPRCGAHHSRRGCIGEKQDHRPHKSFAPFCVSGSWGEALSSWAVRRRSTHSTGNTAPCRCVCCGPAPSDLCE